MDILQEIHDRLDEYLEKTSLLPEDLDTAFSKFGPANVITGPHDVQLIDAIVCERNSQISTLVLQIENVNTAIRKLAAIQARLEENSARVRESLLAHQALASPPARQVPPEILGEVFYHCLSKTAYLTPRDAECPMVLARVCRHWRAVAVTTPRLWSSLSIYLEKTSYEAYCLGLESWLARAKSVPLTLRVLNDLNMSSADPTLISSVVHWLRPLIDRTSGLWWHGPSIPGVFVPDIGTDLAIRHLRITTHRDVPAVHLPGPAHRLRSVSVQCLNYDLQSLDAIDLPWDNLVELSMHFALFSSPLFVRLIARCSHLRTLVLSCLSADGDQLSTLRAFAPGSVVHPRLRRIEIKVIRAGLGTIFGVLTLPTLEELDVCFCYRERDAWPHAAFVEMVRRSGCALKRLTVRSNRTVVPYFGEYVKAMPGLTISTSVSDPLLR